MNREDARKVLENQYRDYLKACQEKGLSLWAVSDDEDIKKLSDYDLKSFIRHFRDAARTPTN